MRTCGSCFFSAEVVVWHVGLTLAWHHARIAGQALSKSGQGGNRRLTYVAAATAQLQWVYEQGNFVRGWLLYCNNS
jgi:hypothetical protein